MNDSTTMDSRQGLAAEFVVPPFSVLDSRAGRWQQRKRLWLARGIGSGAYDDPQTRDGLTFGAADGLGFPGRALKSSSSEFDPVLAEVLIHWFSSPGDVIHDPYAGGPVRGAVADAMGRRYVGCDLRVEQVEHNVAAFSGPRWVCGDAADFPLRAYGRADLLLTCPPYGPLERYSDNPRDLSTMSRSDFRAALFLGLGEPASRMRAGGFAAVVASDVRDRHGTFWGLPGMVRDTLEGAGLREYSRIVFLNRAGSAPIRAGAQMRASRKPVTCHQEVIVYLKGEAPGWHGGAPLALGPQQQGLFG